MKRRTFTAAAPGELAASLARELALDLSQSGAYVARGAVYVRGRRVLEPGAQVKTGDVLTVVLEEEGQSVLGAVLPPRDLPSVLFEDADLLAVLKPSGWNAQPTEGRVGESLLDWARTHLGQEPGLVHRLDRETSGVTVFGKSVAATRALAAQFREARAHKRYLAACVPPLPPGGDIDLPLSRDPSRAGRWRARRDANGTPAFTSYVRLFEDADFALVALFPRTGRTHQLRAHLTALGCPILGDARYGGPDHATALAAPRCMLHAQGLSLLHPTTRVRQLLEAPLPPDLAAFFERARVRAPSGLWDASAPPQGGPGTVSS